MKNYIQFILILLLSNVSIAIISAQTVRTTGDFLRIYEDDIKRIKKPTQGQELGKKAVSAIGMAVDLQTFVQSLPATREYEPVIEYIKMQKTLNRGPLSGTYTKTISQYARHRGADQLRALQSTLTNLGRAASAYVIVDGLYRASMGDLSGNDDAMAAAMDLTAAEILTYFGFSHVYLAVKAIKSAVFPFMNAVLVTNENIVYRGYEKYLLGKYNKDQWWDFYVNNPEKINSILLNEFWNSGEAEALVEEYKQDENLRRNSGIVMDGTGRLAANENIRKEFAYKYYYFHIKGHIAQKRRDAIIQARLHLEGEMAGKLAEARKMKEDAAFLKAELERLTREMNERLTFDEDDIDFIKIVPQEKIVTKGSEVEFQVRIYLKDGSSTLHDDCEAPVLSTSKAGKFFVDANCFGFSDETFISVQVDPKVIISPKEYRFHINDSEKNVAFKVTLLNKYEEEVDVTDEAFENASYHPNYTDYVNADEYPIYAYYEYEGKRLRDEAVVIVTGCEDPDRKLNEAGECKCDTDRGLFENEEGECSKYKGIKLRPSKVSGELDSPFSIEVLGIDGAGNETVIHKFKENVRTEGKEIRGFSWEGYYKTYEVSGRVCPSYRMELDRNGNCTCKPEFIPDGDECKTLDEIEDEAKSDGAGEDVDCEHILAEVRALDGQYAPRIMPKSSSYTSHVELALKLLNDRMADPCNNAAFANSMDQARKLHDDLIGINRQLSADVAEIWGRGGYSCPDIIIAEGEFVDPMKEEIRDITDIQSYLEDKWLEFNCKQEEIDDLSPDLAHDGNRNPAGNVVGGSGSEFPGDGFDNDGDNMTGGGFNPPPPPSGTGNEEANQRLDNCLRSKGTSLATLASDAQQVLTNVQISGAAYENSDENPILCSEYKRDLINYRDFQINLRDCLIQENIQDQPNGPEWIEGTNMFIQIINTTISELPC